MSIHLFVSNNVNIFIYWLWNKIMMMKLYAVYLSMETSSLHSQNSWCQVLYLVSTHHPGKLTALGKVNLSEMYGSSLSMPSNILTETIYNDFICMLLWTFRQQCLYYTVLKCIVLGLKMSWICLFIYIWAVTVLFIGQLVNYNIDIYLQY